MNIEQLIESAIHEDLPAGDLTTSSLGIAARPGEAHLVAKEDFVLSGKDLFEKTVKRLEPHASLQWNFNDGDLILNQQVLAVIRGDLLQVLQAERIGLNFLGRLCGIATWTRCFVKQIEGTIRCRRLF